ncbi:MAG: methylene-tetrahydromethanopterin dehydrogenase N-terminal domain-containing protein [Candidatus Heimdallarchaeota archaeon]
MEVLELKPLKNKHLKLILVESEFPIDWWFEPPVKKRHDLVWNLHLISKEYLNMIKDLIIKYKPNFAIEEKGSRWEDVISHEDPLEVLFKEFDVPYKMIDISGNAEGYLSSNLEDFRTFITDLTKIIEKTNNSIDHNSLKNDYNYQRTILWRDHLQQEYTLKEEEIRYKVREAWMMMKILKFGKEIDVKDQTALFICDIRHFEGLDNLAGELGIEIEQIKISRSAQIINNPGSNSILDIVNKSILELTPIKIKKETSLEKICYIFDTDDIASPFDINMAYDAGFDVVIPISKMKAVRVPKLVQDAIFSRKPKAPTTFFIGGSNVKEGEKIAKKVIESLIPPYECPIIIDPRGSHTTATSVVAKTIEIAREHNLYNLERKKVVIFGAGPVGRIAAILAAKLKFQTYLVEPWEKSNKIFIESLAKELTEEIRDEEYEIIGVFAPNDEKKLEIIKDADIIWALSAAGVEILSRDLMLKLKNKIIIDINLVPPYGIRGLKPKHDNFEIYPSIFGIGALAIGRLKSDIEANILREALNTKGKKIFDYIYAFREAKKILFGSEVEISN